LLSSNPKALSQVCRQKLTDRFCPKNQAKSWVFIKDVVGSVSMVASGTSRLFVSSVEAFDCRSKKVTTIRPDAIVLMADAGIANITFMIGFRFNEATTDGTIFAKQVIKTYVIPCLCNIFHIALDDGVFRRPIIVKASASISYPIV